MRQTLFRIALDHPWSGWFTPPGGLPQLGICWVWLIVCAGWLLYHAIRGHWALLRDPVVWLKAGVGLIGFSLIHYLGFVPASVPVFGYGMMVLLGFVAGLTFSYYRAKAVGYDPEIIVDAAFWILISGVAGGRLAFLIQYWNEVFVPGMPLSQALFRAINLSEGGLVLLGALVGGGLGVFTYFYLRKLSVFEFADLLMPAVFIGVGFGRIGCLLNGCCFGDRCELPWAIHFPAGSVTFDVLASRGFLAEGALWTMPLHPTQIYSSIDGFVLAFVTAVYYWYRKHPGDVLALGCMLYSITRFFIEFLRADEMGQLGTGLTISQLYSIGIFLLGLILMLTGPLRGATRRPAAVLPPQTLPAAVAR
ncbi:prolipoprotein diacylglyceryl transferase [Planctomicrobium piriforme]|uniref:Phosphatidylglycerol--prolipoprotein diacylglyceryl transferase n=1 Tax=Planctomicrobium piriforme TaxID=1576369 RepID=A0A1I3G8A4_9PLAN|nr:prolipoprotein diacylglyceryl transferase family protein [Planctomicrobium piriforme]SFI19462.1 phosphatidylglycerol:prolipoprotein diacylglycerol transferase [Planctomicrobium piriforme]